MGRRVGVSLYAPVLSCVAEFCLLQGKCGGFENETRTDSIFLDPPPFREFAFGDMPDAGQGPSVPNEPLSVLKQGTDCQQGGARWADGRHPCTPGGDVTRQGSGLH